MSRSHYAPHTVIFWTFSKKVTFFDPKSVTSAKTGPKTPKFFPRKRRVPDSARFSGLKKKTVGLVLEFWPLYWPKKMKFFFFLKKTRYLGPVAKTKSDLNLRFGPNQRWTRPQCFPREKFLKLDWS